MLCVEHEMHKISGVSWQNQSMSKHRETNLEEIFTTKDRRAEYQLEKWLQWIIELMMIIRENSNNSSLLIFGGWWKSNQYFENW